MQSREQYEAKKAERKARECDKAQAAKKEADELILRNLVFWHHPDRLVKYTGCLAVYTLLLFVATIALFIATGISAKILYSTDETIGGQLDAMRAEQRPWITIPFGEYSISDIKPPDENGVRAALNIKLINVGKSSA